MCREALFSRGFPRFSLTENYLKFLRALFLDKSGRPWNVSPKEEGVDFHRLAKMANKSGLSLLMFFVHLLILLIRLRC